MKNRKKGIVIVVADIVCIVIWLFLDRNWEKYSDGVLKDYFTDRCILQFDRGVRVLIAGRLQYR